MFDHIADLSKESKESKEWDGVIPNPITNCREYYGGETYLTAVIFLGVYHTQRLL